MFKLGTFATKLLARATFMPRRPFSPFVGTASLRARFDTTLPPHRRIGSKLCSSPTAPHRSPASLLTTCRHPRRDISKRCLLVKSRSPSFPHAHMKQTKHTNLDGGAVHRRAEELGRARRHLSGLLLPRLAAGLLLGRLQNATVKNKPNRRRGGEKELG